MNDQQLGAPGPNGSAPNGAPGERSGIALHQNEPRNEEAAVKWSLHWMRWLQELMLTYAFFV